MITTLRITSLLTAVAAVLVLGAVLGFLPLLGGGAGDQAAADGALDSPSVIERFNEQHGGKAAANQDKTPPLIQQAQLLAGILNPPPPARPVERDGPTQGGDYRPPPPPKDAKFDLVGTSYCASNPAESFAYIRLPGNEYRWVRQGSEVEHFVVTEVKSGSIVYSDGRTESVLPIEPTPSTASLLEPGGAQAAAAVAPGPTRPAMRARTTSPGLGRPVPVQRPSVAKPRSPASNLDTAEQQRMAELVKKLQALQRKSAGSGAEAEAAARERDALRDKLISEFKASNVSHEEAERLEDLGKELSETRSESVLERRREFRRRMSPTPSRDSDDDDK
jgi:hypothetical protein